MTSNPKRASLANLGSRLSAKAGEPSASDTAEDAGHAGSTPRAKRQPDGRRGILVRARPEAWKSLKLIALDGERTLQDVMTEAINDILTKHGKPPVA